MKHRNSNNETTENVARAIAVASETPFKTAFKVTLGIGLAQLTGALLFFGGLTILATTIYFVSK